MSLMWNRLKYVLSPQFDIYKEVAKIVQGEVADIGFGTGFGTHLLMVNATWVRGFEIDENAIHFARSVFPFFQLRFDYGDIVKGIKGEFDYVVMIDVIEHIKEDKKALKSVKKMLAVNGKLICSTPNKLSRYRKAETHCREYSPAEFKDRLSEVFDFVELKNYQMKDLSSSYENPIVAICRKRDVKIIE